MITAYLDCDKDCILLKVRQKGVACHTGTYSCFSQQVKGDENEIGAEMFGKLQRIVEDRKKNPEEGSYTSFLFARGIDKIAKKAGEEAVELVIASKNDDKGEVIRGSRGLPLSHDGAACGKGRQAFGGLFGTV